MSSLTAGSFSKLTNMRDLYASAFGYLSGIVKVAINERKPSGWLKEEFTLLMAEFEDASERIARHPAVAPVTVNRSSAGTDS